MKVLLASVPPEVMLEVAKLAVGAAVVAQARAAGLDRVAQYRPDRAHQPLGALVRLAGAIGDGRGLALGRKMGTVQRLADVDIAEAGHHPLVGERGLEAGFLAATGAGEIGGIEGPMERLGSKIAQESVMLQLVGAGEQHDTETARVVEGDSDARGEMEDHVIMRGVRGARMMETAGLPFLALLHTEGAGHTEVHEQHLAVIEKREQVFGPPLRSE